MRVQRKLSILLPLVFTAFVLNAQTVPYTFKVRDSRTGYAVQAKIQLAGPTSVSAETDKTGKLTVALAPGKYEITVDAPGYDPMKWSTTISPRNNLTTNPQLVPKKQPPELASLDSQVRPGYTLLYGYAVDPDGQPLQDVHIRLQGDSIDTVNTETNARGFFLIVGTTPPQTIDPEDHLPVPGTANLTAEKSGYRTQMHTNITLTGGWGGMLLDMERGSGTEQTDETPSPMRHGAGTVPGDENDYSPEQQTTVSEQGQRIAMGGSLDLPATIVVGIKCPKKWRCQKRQ